MSLSVQPIMDAMVRQFTTSASSARFGNDFIDAFNYVLDDLWASGGLDATITHIQSPEETVTGLDECHSRIVNAGLVYYLGKLGQKHANIESAHADEDWNGVNGGIAKFVTMQQRALQADVDSDGDPSGEIAGLGYIK